MTSYTLSIGYLSGYSTDLDRDAAWLALLESVNARRSDPQAIIREAKRFDAPDKCRNGCCTIAEAAAAYDPSNNDLTVVVIDERGPDGEDNRRVVQYASGDRDLKEHVRRAFCRLIIQDMHRRGIEVDLSVA